MRLVSVTTRFRPRPPSGRDRDSRFRPVDTLKRRSLCCGRLELRGSVSAREVERNVMETNVAKPALEHEAVTRQKLVADLKVVVRDAEALIKATAGELGEKAKEARARLMDALETAKMTCHRLEEKAVAGAKATDKIIREHPYQSIGIAFGLGLLIGVLVNRK